MTKHNARVAASTGRTAALGRQGQWQLWAEGGSCAVSVSITINASICQTQP
jgi:hypothetical protein